jgi:aminoglycoside phosphotransferase (APT) family kinase protein
MEPINPPIQRQDATNIVDFAIADGCRMLGVVPLPGGQVNSTGMLILDDGRRLVLRIAPDPVVGEQGPSWLTPYGLRRELAVIAAAPDLAPLLPVTVAHDFEGSVLNRDWVLRR